MFKYKKESVEETLQFFSATIGCAVMQVFFYFPMSYISFIFLGVSSGCFTFSLTRYLNKTIKDVFK